MVVIEWRTEENLAITQEIEVLGSTVADTYVRIKNEGNQKYTVGIRYLWGIMISENTARLKTEVALVKLEA